MNQAERCENCGKEVLHPFEAVDFSNGTPRLLCNACYNEEVAARAGIDFRHPEFAPVQLTDAVGAIHSFHFATRLVDVSRMSIEAYEPDADPGYRFQVIAGSAGDPRGAASALAGEDQASTRPRAYRRRCAGFGVTSATKRWYTAGSSGTRMRTPPCRYSL